MGTVSDFVIDGRPLPARKPRTGACSARVLGKGRARARDRDKEE
jgi:hypothetical protein